MSESITVRGFVATEVREDTTHGGDSVASFRMGATERRYNRDNQTWEDGDTNWFSVACFRGLARNVAFSVQKGEKVIVSGRLKIRNWSMPDGRSGTTADIDAETVGHDLMWGLSKYKRVSKEDPVPWNGAQNQNGETESEQRGLNRETGELTDDDGNAAGNMAGGNGRTGESGPLPGHDGPGIGDPAGPAESVETGTEDEDESADREGSSFAA